MNNKVGTLRFLKKNFFLLILFAFLIFIRFWKAPDFFSFNFDEEYQASLAWEQVKNFHIIWIGVSASNLNYYLGPAFTYLNALLFYLSKGDPISLAYFSSLLGIVTMFSVYYITSKLFSSKTAIIASILYGGSALINFYDRRFWNVSPVMIVSLWTVYSLIRSYKDRRWLILTTILFAFFFHIHLSLMTFIPLIIITFTLNIKKISLKSWLLIIASYFIITSPLLVFDFVHNFDNLKAPFRFLTSPKLPEHSIDLPTIQWHKRIYFSSLGRLWQLRLNTNIQDEQTLGQHSAQTYEHPFFIFITLASIIFMITKLKSNFPSRYLTGTVFLFTLIYLLYPGPAAEYYLLGMIVFLPIIIAFMLEKLPQIITVILLLFFLVFNSLTIINTNQSRYGLTARQRLIKKTINIIKNKPYALEIYGKDGRKYHPYGGWRYLFARSGNIPSVSFADEFFGWIYAAEIPKEKPVYKVVVTEETDYQSKQIPIKVIREGAFTSYIIKK